MGTTNIQLEELIQDLRIQRFRGCFFKDDLNDVLPYSSYIINLHNRFNENTGEMNPGSHWVALVTDGEKQAIYFDSYGEGIPKHITRVLKWKNYKYGNTNKNIQGLRSDLCGFFAVAFIYFLTKHPKRTKKIFDDALVFVQLFENLDKVKNDLNKNENILSLFFKGASKEVLLKNNNIGVNSRNHLPDDFDIEEHALRID